MMGRMQSMKAGHWKGFLIINWLLATDCPTKTNLDAVDGNSWEADEGDQDQSLDTGGKFLVYKVLPSEGWDVATEWLTDDEHVTRQSVEDPTNRIGLEQLYGRLEQVVKHLVVEVGSGTGSWGGLSVFVSV